MNRWGDTLRPGLDVRPGERALWRSHLTVSETALEPARRNEDERDGAARDLERDVAAEGQLLSRD